MGHEDNVGELSLFGGIEHANGQIVMRLFYVTTNSEWIRGLISPGRQGRSNEHVIIDEACELLFSLEAWDNTRWH